MRMTCSVLSKSVQNRLDFFFVTDILLRIDTSHIKPDTAILVITVVVHVDDVAGEGICDGGDAAGETWGLIVTRDARLICLLGCDANRAS
jgi:hypothetical protein